MDALLLARMQFAANITFHILFPTITIALGWTLLFFRWRWLPRATTAWLGAYRFWTKVFALSFALGVVSGITMSFQFGTNWPGFMERVGNIAGPLLGYEVLTAFFLEATFLGIMLFGHGRVSERVHLLATFLVAFGTTMSAFWILALNSWMHTPAGHEIRDGEFFVTSWLQVIFNPSFPYRLTHVLLASGLTVAFLLAGVAPGSCCAARPTPVDGQVAAHRPDAGRGADPAADLGGRPARPEHAGAPAAEGGGDGRASGRPSAARRCCCSPCPTRGAQQPLRDRHPQGREPDPEARPRRRDPRPERVRPASTRRWRRCSTASASWWAPAC
jgi:hypothetical protein